MNGIVRRHHTEGERNIWRERIHPSEHTKGSSKSVSAKYCYAAHESRLHQNDRCKRFTLV